MNTSVALAALLKPFILFVIMVCILYPARRAVEKYMKDGKLKSLLLKKTN